jgi:hypothetical protein
VIACHGGEPRGVHDGDPIVGVWDVLDGTARESVTFQVSGTYAEHGRKLFDGVAYGWRRETPERISVLRQFDTVLDVQAVLTEDLQGLSLAWDHGSVKLARGEASDGALR